MTNNEDLAADQAWKIVRLATEEARARYHLELYGTVAPNEGGSYDLKLAWAQKGLWVRQAMTREFLLDTDPEMVAATVFYPIIDILVTGRDADHAPARIQDALRNRHQKARQDKAGALSKANLPPIEKWD